MHDPAVTTLTVEPRGRVRVLARDRDDDLDVLAEATVVVGVGTGVAPDEYPALDPLLAALGAELGATRKVTDKGWLPRARQIGITGRTIAPRLYVAIGLAGKFNHMVGVRAAGTVLAINPDPDALVFGAADIGIVGDWHDVVPLLVAELRATPRSPCADSAAASFFGGRQNVARNATVPPIATTAVISSAFLGSNGNEKSNASSSDHSPGPIAPSAIDSTATVPTYSQPSPGLLMKKPFFQWLVTSATSTIDATPAYASGVRKPEDEHRPERRAR